MGLFRKFKLISLAEIHPAAINPPRRARNTDRASIALTAACFNPPSSENLEDF